MGKTERRRRRRSRKSSIPTSIHDLPQDLLELVLLHAHSSVCLVRAAATCKPWRRVIAGGDAFLRRFRRLHPPHLLGHYHDRPEPSFVPSSPTPPGDAAIKVGRLRHVSLDFLSPHYHGSLMELSDSGSLLAFIKDDSRVVVCDPWTGEQRQLRPPSPWEDHPGRFCSYYTFGAFLLNAGEEDDDDDTSSINMSCFRMLCAYLVRDSDTGTKTACAAMFTARHGGRWTPLGSSDVAGAIMHRRRGCMSATEFLGRAGGGSSLCWSSGVVRNAVLHLDESSGTFSVFTMPADHASRGNLSTYYNRENLRVVGGGAGFVCLARILGDDLEVLRWSRDGGDECIVERKVCLSQLVGIELVEIEWSWRFLDTAETLNPGHVVLLPYKEYMWMFDLNVETMELTRLQKSKNEHTGRVFPYYLPWPPVIKVCV